MTDKLDLSSPDFVNENLEKIAAIFPNCVTEGPDGKVVDFDLLKQELNHDVIEGTKERYRLEWPGKRQAMVNANLPTTKTLRPVREDSVNFDNTQNLYIEGDNLEVLKILQESYLGKIKMIYIDPPYNTGKDFVYKDNFTQDSDEYKQESGQIDQYNRRLVTNPDNSGRYHSDWLSMIYPRIKLGRNLLTEDGVMFISIDDSEVAQLRQIMDDLFGEYNRIDRGMLVWVNRGSTKGFKNIVKNHEYILGYAKNSELVKNTFGKNFPDKLENIEHYCFNKPNPSNPICSIYFPSGTPIRGAENAVFKKQVGSEVSLLIEEGEMIFKAGILTEGVHLTGAFPYRTQIQAYFENLKKGEQTVDTKGQVWKEIYFNSRGLPRYEKIRNTKVISSVIDEDYIPNYGSNRIKELFGAKEIFSFPKPLELIKELASYFITDGDICLDYFAGSSSTADAIIELSEETEQQISWINVQLPEKTQHSNNPEFAHLAAIGRERIRRSIELVSRSKQNSQTTGFRTYYVDESNMADVYYQPRALDQRSLDIFASNIKADRTAEDLLTQVLLDWGLSLTLKTERAMLERKEVFKVAGDSLYACFDEGLDEAFAKAVAAEKPLRLVVKDSAFASDTAKVNVQQLLKQLSPNTEMKVI